MSQVGEGQPVASLAGERLVKGAGSVVANSKSQSPTNYVQETKGLGYILRQRGSRCSLEETVDTKPP